MTESPARPLTVDVVSDVVCPWCFVGKRRLDAALALLAADGAPRHATVRWHAFQLNPDLPPEGIDRDAYLDAKFGGVGRAAQIYDRVRAVGAAVGIPFAFERIARQPNTTDAHRLIEWAQDDADPDGAEELVERLFAAYFVDGRYPGDRDVLAAVAGEAGLDAAAARAMLDSDRYRDAVQQAQRRSGELGIGGVPFFIFDGRVAVSGAQEPRMLVDAIVEAAKHAPA